jgi:hypothetical protein
MHRNKRPASMRGDSADQCLHPTVDFYYARRMSSGTDEKSEGKASAKFWLGVAAVVIGAIAVAFLTPIVSSWGEAVADRFGAPGPALVTASDKQSFLCWGGTFFVPNDSPNEYLPTEVSPGDFAAPDDCNQLIASVNGVPVNVDISASFRAETDQPAIITGIHVVNVSQTAIPPGTYVTPAMVGGYYAPKYILLDLDQTPIMPVDIGEYVDGEGTRSFVLPEPGWLATTPLTPDQILQAPWKISKDEPLQILVLTKGTKYDVTFSVELSWASGEHTGEILLDNRGQGYRSIGGRTNTMQPNYVISNQDGGWKHAVAPSNY